MKHSDCANRKLEKSFLFVSALVVFVVNFVINYTDLRCHKNWISVPFLLPFVYHSSFSSCALHFDTFDHSGFAFGYLLDNTQQAFFVELSIFRNFRDQQVVTYHVLRTHWCAYYMPSHQFPRFFISIIHTWFSHCRQNVQIIRCTHFRYVSLCARCAK